MTRIGELAGKGWARPLLAGPLLVVFGVLVWGAFNWSLELTNTEAFCTSCHEMRDNVLPSWRKSSHYLNATGVRASCPDCHVPRPWGAKVMRKIQATNELFHWIAGTVSTRRKFEAARGALARSVWSQMKATDSRECRNCHLTDYMSLADQSPKAGQMHARAGDWGMTCIDCHQGIAHDLPADFDRAAAMDAVHERIEREGMDCKLCHENIRRARRGDGWD